jgi:mannonate dehydratase
MNRRQFIGGSAALGLIGAARSSSAAPADPAAPALPVKMVVGHQHDHTPGTLRLLAALGVENICSGKLGNHLDESWSVAGLKRLKAMVEGYGIKLDAIPLPMSSSPIATAENPDILLARDPGRDHAIADICQMIRNAGEAGVTLLKYNLTFLGVVRTGHKLGRGGATYSSFEYSLSNPDGPETKAGKVSAQACWDRITYFLEKVVPVATEAGVRIALHPNDPGLPQDRPYHGVHAVLASVEGLKRFVDTVPSPFHGLNFCQGTISEMLPRPGDEIYDVIRYFGQRQKIFNVHFRNIAGGFGNFTETFPDNGSVDMPRALRIYREVGFKGMVMPDHAPAIEGDTERLRAFSYCFGYIQALLQVLRAETALQSGLGSSGNGKFTIKLKS